MIERFARVAAPVAVGSFAVIGAVSARMSPAEAVPIAAVVLLAGVAAAWWRLTGWPLVGTLAVAAAGLVVICHATSSNLGWFGMCVIAGWVTLRATLFPAAVTAAAFAAIFIGEWLAPNDETGWGAWIAGVAFTTVACVFARRQRQLLDELRVAQAGLADRARAEERNRIAGEMHDVIGHALTVSLLHVSSAALALDEDPDEARASLAEAERLARQSLEEVRSAVGLMRETDGAGMTPMPSGADVAELVESFRRAGSRVELDVEGDLDALGAARGLAVYRIVQESLTNAVRHGGGAPVTVRVRIGDDGATVTVVSGGRARADAVEGAGLLGMRERAEALGGKLLAGPSPEGWRVEAVLPS